MMAGPALPPGILINACQSTPSALPLAVLDILADYHADHVSAMRIYDAKPASDPLAAAYAAWAGDAQRRAKRIREVLRGCGCDATADRLAALAHTTMPVTCNDGAAA